MNGSAPGLADADGVFGAFDGTGVATRSPDVAAGSRALLDALPFGGRVPRANAALPAGLAATALAAAAGSALTAAPGAVAPFPGLTGFLPYSGLFGSQFRFFSNSAASCSAVRCGTLLRNGIGTLVTYKATPRARARPTSRPTIRPMAKPPR